MGKNGLQGTTRSVFELRPTQEVHQRDDAGWRTITRGAYDAERERMRQKLDTEEGKAVYGKRKCLVEPVIGQLKVVGRLVQFLLRGPLGGLISNSNGVPSRTIPEADSPSAGRRPRTSLGRVECRGASPAPATKARTNTRAGWLSRETGQPEQNPARKTRQQRVFTQAPQSLSENCGASVIAWSRLYGWMSSSLTPSDKLQGGR